MEKKENIFFYDFFLLLLFNMNLKRKLSKKELLILFESYKNINLEIAFWNRLK